MATRAFQQEGPTGLSTALSVIPSLPRPLLSRLVARAIERLDDLDGDPDLEDDDPAGGNVEDDGEKDDQALVPHYGLDQRLMLAASGLIRWRDE